MTDFPLTMERPSFNGVAKYPESSWSDEEINSWVARTEANPDDFPWRLQWVDDARVTLVARNQAGANV